MRRSLALLAAGALALTACGSDDGADVRTIDGEGGSISGSGSLSGSASGSATGASGSATGASGSATGASGSATGASGSASGSAVADCVEQDISDADTTIDVALTEWAITPEVDEVEAGRIGFVASTENAAEPHELVIVRGDDPAALPTDEDGALVEDELDEGAMIGEIEAFPAGTTCSGAFDLDPGTYVLLCNIVETEEDGTVEAHYAEGMFTTFTVTG